MTDSHAEDVVVSDERLKELISMAIGSDTKQCLLELQRWREVAAKYMRPQGRPYEPIGFPGLRNGK